MESVLPYQFELFWKCMQNFSMALCKFACEFWHIIHSIHDRLWCGRHDVNRLWWGGRGM